MVRARGGKINRIGIYVIAAILLLLVMTVTLWPRYCKIEGFDDIAPTMFNMYTTSSTKNRTDFEKTVYTSNKNNTRSDSRDFFQFLGCYHDPTGYIPLGDKTIDDYIKDTGRYVEKKTLTTDEFGDVIGDIKKSLSSFSLKCGENKIIKGPVYVYLSQVPVTLDSQGNYISNSMFNAPIQNSEDPTKSKLYSPYRKYNTDGTVTEKGQIQYNYKIIYDRYDKVSASSSTALLKAADINSFQYSVLTYLNKNHASKNRNCFMSGIGVRGQEVFAGCTSLNNAKCLGPSKPNMDDPDISAQKTLSTFSTLYKINSDFPLIDNSEDKVDCNLIKAKGVYTPYECQKH
ncbi:MAG: hypothetical protein EB127_12910 [Alphaproteobacteria bacterium]|nr:hypothetical protein [Alphaproteobacteria bacterium]